MYISIYSFGTTFPEAKQTSPTFVKKVIYLEMSFLCVMTTWYLHERCLWELSSCVRSQDVLLSYSKIFATYEKKFFSGRIEPTSDNPPNVLDMKRGWKWNKHGYLEAIPSTLVFIFLLFYSKCLNGYGDYRNK